MSTKKLIRLALLLIVVGAMLLSVSACSADGGFLGIFYSEHETERFDITEDFDNISINIDTADLDILPSDDGGCRVVAYSHKEINYCATVDNGTLKIGFSDDRAWYQHIGINESELTVYLPASVYSALKIVSGTGDINVPADFSFESIDISLSTGDVEMYASATDFVRIETSTGDIEVSDMSATSLSLITSTGDIEVEKVSCTGDFYVEVTTGDTEIESATCGSFTSDGGTGSISMDDVIAFGKVTIDRNTGDIKLYYCDAAELEIETSTGSVSGVLLSEKVFITHTGTGHIDVPESITGGKCKVTTSTGDITFEFAE